MIEIQSKQLFKVQKNLTLEKLQAKNESVRNSDHNKRA